MILLYYQIVLSSPSKIFYFISVIYILWGLFLVESILWYYQIVLSSTRKIYFYSALILLLMRTISCRTSSILLSNCYFLYNKVLLLYFIYFFFHEVFFRYNPFYVIIKLFFPLQQRFATLLQLFYISWGLLLVEPVLYYY